MVSSTGQQSWPHNAIAIRRRHLLPLGLEGMLGLPGVRPKGLVIFAYGSGSSRFSPRNNSVAKSFRQAGLATLLCDLLTESEAANRVNVFDIAYWPNGWSPRSNGRKSSSSPGRFPSGALTCINGVDGMKHEI